LLFPALRLPSVAHRVKLADRFKPIESSLVSDLGLSVNYFTDSYLPFYYSSSFYGRLISSSVNPDGTLSYSYQYSPSIHLIRSTVTGFDPSVRLTTRVFNSSSNSLLFSFTDDFLSPSLFRRNIDGFLLYISNGSCSLTERSISFKPIPPLNKSLHYQDRFLTLDLETYLSNSLHTPFALAFGSGDFSSDTDPDFNFFYISDYSSSDDLLIDCFRHLLVPKFNNLVVYAHNLGRFDGVFLLKVLSPHFLLKPLMKDNKLISLSVSLPSSSKSVSLKLYDSYLLLPSSLRDLSISFNTTSSKYPYPYSFVTSAS